MYNKDSDFDNSQNKSMPVSINNEKNAKKSQLLQSAGWVVAVLLTLLFIFVGRPYFEKQAYNQGKADQLAEDIIKLEGTGPLAQVEINNVSGVITEIGDKMLTLRTDPLPNNPLRDPLPEIREGVVDDSTEFVQLFISNTLSPETPEEAVDTPPSSFTPVSISFADLKVGDAVEVYSDEEDLAYKTKFLAKRVQSVIIPDFTPPTNQ